MAGPYETLDQLQGLEGAKKAVRRLASSDSGAHAVLFYGQPGSGTTTLAMALAQAWLCPQAGPEGPCGTCPVCAAFAAGRAVDFQVVQPWGLQSLIKLSAVKEPGPGEADPYQGVPLRSYFRTRPLMARVKAALIEHVDRFNSDAANSFLKLLEEPPSSARFVLTTSELGRVLPTIRSRCLCVACELPEWKPSNPAAATPGEEAKLASRQEDYVRLMDVLDQNPWRPEDALGISRELRAWADALAKKTDLTPRQANAEAARCLALWLHRNRSEFPAAAQAAAEACRAIMGNGSASLVFDGLLSSVCQSREQGAGAPS